MISVTVFTQNGQTFQIVAIKQTSKLPDNLGLRFIKKLRPVTFNKDHRDTYVDTVAMNTDKRMVH
jgi:hypothetical protein